MSPHPAVPALEEEDRARADLYALLARIYYQGPDGGVLALVARSATGIAPETVGPLVVAWRALATAAASAAPAAAQQEYDDLFVGTGRAEVSPYATHYLSVSGREKLLVELRDELAAMGLSRKETSREPEDHFAGLFDVMRHLVERGATDAALRDQRRFFGRYIAPSYAGFCAAIDASPRAGLFAPVAAFTRAYLDLEEESLQLI